MCEVYGGAKNLTYELSSSNSTTLNQFKQDWIKIVEWVNDTFERVYWIVESRPELDALELAVLAYEERSELQLINDSLNCNYMLHYRRIATSTMATDEMATDELTEAKTDIGTVDAKIDPAQGTNASKALWTSHVYTVNGVVILIVQALLFALNENNIT